MVITAFHRNIQPPSSGYPEVGGGGGGWGGGWL
jgi:hypothetical protein